MERKTRKQRKDQEKKLTNALINQRMNLGTAFDNKKGRVSQWFKPHDTAPVETLSKTQIESLGLAVSDRPLERNPEPEMTRALKKKARRVRRKGGGGATEHVRCSVCRGKFIRKCTERWKAKCMACWMADKSESIELSIAAEADKHI